MKKRTGWLSLIAALAIISGILSIVSSIPVFSLYNSIRQEGITVNTGVTIKQIQPDSPSLGKLRIDDEIISINDKEVSSPDEVIKTTEANQGKALEIVVKRNGDSINYSITPRANLTPGQGRLGIFLVQNSIQKKPLSQIIPQVILRAYSGYEETPVLPLIASSFHQDKYFTRLQSLILGIITIIIGIGLWKLKHWAWYGFLILTGISLIVFITSLANSLLTDANSTKIQIYPLLSRSNTDINLFASILSISLEIIFVIYVYKLKGLFIRK